MTETEQRQAGRLAVVCVCYTPEKIGPTLRAIEAITGAVPAARTVFVANQHAAWAALNEAQAASGASVELLLHDNSGMEFGAYQAGIERIQGAVDCDWLLLANDTFATHHHFTSVDRKKLVLALGRRVDHPIVFGQVVGLNRSFAVEGLRTHRWVTTNLFALNRAAVDALGGQIWHPELDRLITDTSEPSRFFEPCFDPVLREHLETWLFRARPGWHWYGAAPLQPGNAVLMARKARSIVQEKSLAARLEAAGAEFFDLDELDMANRLRRNAERRLFSWLGRR